MLFGFRTIHADLTSVGLKVLWRTQSHLSFHFVRQDWIVGSRLTAADLWCLSVTDSSGIGSVCRGGPLRKLILHKARIHADGTLVQGPCTQTALRLK